MSDWRDQALCRTADAELFFDDSTRVQNALIRNYCRRCPVMDACLDEALKAEGGIAASGRAGVWGGLTPNARAVLSRKQRKEAS